MGIEEPGLSSDGCINISSYVALDASFHLDNNDQVVIFVTIAFFPFIPFL